MPTRRATPGQAELLEWQPPQPVARFAPEAVRGATLAHTLSRAVSVALQECGMTRAEVAERMSGFLGERVTESALNGYASPARDDRPITMTRFLALMHATRDRRLLELLAEPMGWAVIERRHLASIELAAVYEAEEQLKRRKRELRGRVSGT